MSAERSDEADTIFVDAVARRVVELLREEGVVYARGPQTDHCCRGIAGVRGVNGLGLHQRRTTWCDPAWIGTAGATAL